LPNRQRRSVAASVNAIHSQNPSKSMTVLTLPDKPPAALSRGHSDVDRMVDDEFWGVGQYLDFKWMMPHEAPDPMARAKSNSRRWSGGRCIVQHAAMEGNAWWNCELLVAGRPLHRPVVRPANKIFFALQWPAPRQRQVGKGGGRGRHEGGAGEGEGGGWMGWGVGVTGEGGKGEGGGC
jgi:hypothetical protein